MAKPKEEKQEVVTVDEPLTHSALSTVKLEDGWYVAEVRFNPQNNKSGNVIFTKAGTTREEAIDRFKLMAVNLNTVG